MHHIDHTHTHTHTHTHRLIQHSRLALGNRCYVTDVINDFIISSGLCEEMQSQLTNHRHILHSYQHIYYTDARTHTHTLTAVCSTHILTHLTLTHSRQCVQLTY